MEKLNSATVFFSAGEIAWHALSPLKQLYNNPISISAGALNSAGMLGWRMPAFLGAAVCRHVRPHLDLRYNWWYVLKVGTL